MQVFYIILTVCCLTAAAALQEDDDIKQEWLNFKEKFNKKYATRSLEEQIRYKIFKQNVETIQKHNEKYQNGEVSYEMGINPYTDMDAKEIERNLMGAEIIERHQELLSNGTSTFESFAGPRANLPASLDWRQTGAITPVKNQGSCGSCWAFSSTGALEAHHFLKYKKSVILSEQNLVDCVKDNNGCGGGWMYRSFNYVRTNGGINTEKAYPYEAKNGLCRFQRQQIGATSSGYVSIRSGDEQQLLEAVATRGPVSVAFYTLSSFHQYKSGIYDQSNCKSNSLHAVLVVGYGRENGRDYWLVKNSWGSRWGDNGYVKMSRNKNNQCSIATWASYPLV